MQLDPHVKRLLDILGASRTGTSGLTPHAMRQAISQLAQLVDVKNVPIGGTENRNIPCSTHSVPIRIYTPAAANAEELAALIYFHGGTGVFCSIETHDGLCRMLANESGCRVISVGYRLAPEHKFPAAVEDSYAATRWICAHAPVLGIDPKQIAIGGDSAGATLAAVVCQLAKQLAGPELALQVLLCPVTDISAEGGSRSTFSQGYFFDMATLKWSLEHYLPSHAAVSDPRISPLRASDLSGLPPTHIHTAEFDPVRDEGKAYADGLRRAGVSVRYTCHQGMIHHFYCMAGVIPYARCAVKTIGDAIRAALAKVSK
jgi:acetyl esterase